MPYCIEKVIPADRGEDLYSAVKPCDGSTPEADLSSQSKFRFELDMSLFVVELNLSCIHLTDIPKQVSECKSLHSLDMSHNSLTNVSFDLSSFPMLSRLNLSHNSLSSLPTSLSQVPMLSVLSLSNNQLSSLPVTMASSSTIRQLFLDSNYLSSLPCWIFKLFLCSKISLSHNPLELGDMLNFHHAFGRTCRRLKYLDLSNLSMNAMPITLCELLDLRHLNVSNTKSTKVMQVVPNMNRLSSFPTELSRLKGLVKLQAVGVNLSELPDSFHLLSNLEILDISDNSIVWLPSSIHLLSKLRFLNISNNNIYLLPLDFEKLPSLEHLLASHNRISELPEKLEESDKLVTLDVYNNRLHKVELDIARGLVRCDFAMNHFDLKKADESLLNLYRSKEKILRSWEEELGENFIASIWQGKQRSSDMKPEESGEASDTEQQEELDLLSMNWEESEQIIALDEESNEVDESGDGNDSEDWTVEEDLYDLPVKFGFSHNLKKMHLEQFWGKEQFCPSDQHAQPMDEKILELVEKEIKRRRRLEWVGRVPVETRVGFFSSIQEHQFDDVEEAGDENVDTKLI